MVLLSPYARGELNQIDPAKLARNLAGVAVVVRVDDPELTWDFADEVGRQLSCFNGAARHLLARILEGVGPAKPPIVFSGLGLSRSGLRSPPRTIERAIFAVAAFRYVPDGRIADVIRRADAAERQKLLVEKKETGDDFWADYERDLARLDEAEKRLEELEAENANLRANQQVFFAAGVGGPDELAQPEESEEPSRSLSRRGAVAGCGEKRCNPTWKSSTRPPPPQRRIFLPVSDLTLPYDRALQWR